MNGGEKRRKADGYKSCPFSHGKGFRSEQHLGGSKRLFTSPAAELVLYTHRPTEDTS